jgi:hypothetical protein
MRFWPAILTFPSGRRAYQRRIKAKLRSSRHPIGQTTSRVILASLTQTTRDPDHPATPEIPGLRAGSNKRNREWHFTNVPFTMDNTPTMPPAPTNVLTKILDFQGLATFGLEMQTYVFPWLIHLVGDVHQPLHAVAFFRQDLPNGDSGGNDIEMKSGGKLHAFWDDRVGTSISDCFIGQTVATITMRHPKPPQISIDPAVWVNDSVEQRFFVYSFSGRGTHQDPAVVSDKAGSGMSK